MNKILLTTISVGVLALAACAPQTPEPIIDDSTYSGGKGEIAAPTPEPKPKFAKCPFGTDNYPTGVYRTDIGPDAYCDERGGGNFNIPATSEQPSMPERPKKPKQYEDVPA